MNTKHGILLIGIALLVFCVFIGTASATTIYVPDNYTKIQWAVDNATVGDTIIVKSGIYYENVNVNKQLILIGVDTDGRKPIVDAGMSGSAITLSADRIVLEGFIATNSSWAGINATSNNNIGRHNNVSYNRYYGIYLYGASNNTVIDNNVSYNRYYGIYLYGASNNTVIDNNVSYNDYHGIYLYGASNNTVIDNNVSYNRLVGISLESSSNNIITGNNISYNKWGHGIYLRHSSDNIITGNNVSNNKQGIYLIHDSNNNAITNNTVSNNDKSGICLCESISNTITNNRASNNDYSGIFLCSYSNSNTITDNTFSNNNYNGIDLVNSNYNTITGNNVSNNNNSIHFWYTYRNKIYLNNFIKNANNVCSTKSTSIWNSTEKIIYVHDGTTYENYLGNYWSDYKGTDDDQDGIGEDPYSTDLDKDYYPLMEPWENYIKAEKERKAPGFGVIFAIAGLLIIAYILKRRKK